MKASRKHKIIAVLPAYNAARTLERVSGRIDPEEILGLVFSQFCIGK